MTYCLSDAIGPASLSDCSWYDIYVIELKTTHSRLDLGTNVVHLKRDILNPCLACLQPKNNRRKFRANNCLGVKGLAKGNSLVRPSIISASKVRETSRIKWSALSLQTLLNHDSLCTEARRS
jgi:hypothetical protein